MIEPEAMAATRRIRNFRQWHCRANTGHKSIMNRFETVIPLVEKVQGSIISYSKFGIIVSSREERDQSVPK